MPLDYKQLRVESTDGKPDLKKRQERLATLGADGWKLVTTVYAGDALIDTLARPSEQATYPQA